MLTPSNVGSYVTLYHTALSSVTGLHSSFSLSKSGSSLNPTEQHVVPVWTPTVPKSYGGLSSVIQGLSLIGGTFIFTCISYSPPPPAGSVTAI